MTQAGHFSKLALVILFAFVAVGGVFYSYLGSISKSYGTYALLPEGQKISLDLARTDVERARGLSGRQSIKEDAGMYFIFPREDRYGFWMKDMEFPIDIIWIHQGKVVGVAENVQAQPGATDSELEIYYPPEAVNAVLEMKAGAARRYTIDTGDRIQVQIIPDK